MAHFRWSEHPEIAGLVFETYPQAGSTDLSRRIAQEFGVHLSPGAVRDYYRHETTRRKLAERGQEAPPAPVAETPPADARRPDQRTPMGPREAEELYRAAMEETERKEATSLAQTTLTVDFSSERLPVGVCFWSDWQLGTSGVMMRQLDLDAQAVQAAEGLQTFVMGDLIQNLNAKVHPQSLHECVLPDPREQEVCARYVLEKCRGKIQGMVDGNHENNSKRAAGLTLTERWAKELEVPYLWHGALVTFRVGGQEYTLGLRHKFRGESGVNTTNAQRLMYDAWYPADVMVLGHLHYNDMQKRPKPGRDTVFLRAGSYQKWDEFGQFCGGYKGAWGIPLVILYPDTRRILPFYGNDFYVALRVLEAERRFYRENSVGKARCA